jgi:integrating conjugative element protein (TIGR03749 family)
MKRSVCRASATALLWLGLASATNAVEILHWERLPLAVPLIVGQERVVFLDRDVRVGIPPELADQLRVQSTGGAVYLRASEPFTATRLQIQDTASGAIVLLDVEAKPGKPNQPPLEPVRIDPGDTLRQGDDGAEQPPPDASAWRPTRQTPVAVILTRYAAQQLYAPLRALETVSGLTQVGLDPRRVLPSLAPALPVAARTLAAWRLEDQWVTAVQLTHTGAGQLALDPRFLQGDFVAATFQHAVLGPSGSQTDTTTVYLVTRGHGLTQSLLPTASPVDAALNLPASDPGATADEFGHEE